MRPRVSGFVCAFFLVAASTISLSQQTKSATAPARKVTGTHPTSARNPADKLLKQAQQYRLGEGVAKDEARAADLYRQAAETGNAEGETWYGEALFEGRGVARDRAAAMQWFEKAAAQKYARAETDLGVIYFQGLGVPKDFAKAREWLQLGAAHGDARAENDLGQMAQFGLGVQQNNSEAYEHYLKAASAGSAWGCFNVGLLNQFAVAVQQNYETAVRWYLKAISLRTPEAGYEWGYLRGDARAIDDSMFQMGRLYEAGNGVPKDSDEAQQWFRQGMSLEHEAALAGWPQAQTYYGNDYSEGTGTGKDIQEALSWYLKAAGKDDAEAELALAYIYHQGEGVNRDDAQALQWLRKAVDQSQPAVQEEIGNYYANGWGVNQDAQQAIAWYQKAAANNYPNALVSLGTMYLNGQGVGKDPAQAVSWYRKAAEQGSGNGQFRLGWAYETGTGVAKDYSQALEWYQKAAAQKDAYADTFLGAMYYNGEGVSRDYVQALGWFRKAADMGYAGAQSWVGSFYAQGWGVPKDLNQARYWYGKAADQGDENGKKAIASLGPLPAGYEPEQAGSDPSIPNVQFRPNSQGKPLTDPEQQKLFSGLHWVPADSPFQQKSYGRADLMDGNGRRLATVRVSWDAAEQRIVADGSSSNPQKAWNNSPKIWALTLTVQLQNNSLCMFSPQGEVKSANDDFVKVVDSAGWSSWTTLHNPIAGGQNSIQREFIVRQPVSAISLHMEDAQYAVPITGCLKTDQPQQQNATRAGTQANNGGQGGPGGTQTGAASGGSCNWSSQFDQIRDPEKLDALHVDWRQRVQQSGQSVQQLLAAMEQTRSQLQQHLEEVKQSIIGTAAEPVTSFDFTFDYVQTCKNNPNRGANLAAECEYVNTQDALRGADGTIEILQCMGGQPGSAGAQQQVTRPNNQSEIADLQSQIEDLQGQVEDDEQTAQDDEARAQQFESECAQVRGPCIGQYSIIELRGEAQSKRTDAQSLKGQIRDLQGQIRDLQNQ